MARKANAMKLLTLTQDGANLGATKDVPILINPAMIFSLEPTNGGLSLPGTIINGRIKVKESVDDIKAAFGPGPGRKVKY